MTLIPMPISVMPWMPPQLYHADGVVIGGDLEGAVGGGFVGVCLVGLRHMMG